MPIYEFTAPDGQVYEVEGPEGSTEQQAFEQLQSNMPAPTMPDSPSGFAQGLADPLYGASQALENVLPDSITGPVNQFNDYLIDEFGAPLQRMGDGGVDAQIAQREQGYQAAREAAGETGLDLDRIAGNVLSTAIPGAGVIGRTSGIVPKIAGGAVAGAAGAGVMPVTEGEYLSSKLKQMLTGSIFGAGGSATAAGLGRMFDPMTSNAVKVLKSEGVRLTGGQAGGNVTKKLEEAARSVPGIGDTISMAHTRGIEGLNKAAINRSLAPIGKVLPDDMKAGREAVDYAKDSLGGAYNKILPKMKGELDGQMIDELDSLKVLTQSLPDSQQVLFKRITDNEIVDRFTEYGRASGDTLKQIESKLGRIAKEYGKSQDYDVRQLGDAVKESQSVLRSMITRHNPEYADEMAAINTGYSNYKIVENAASRIGANEGIFTPAQLNAAVRFKDYSKDKSAFARGKAQMQDLSQAGKSVLAQTVPDSGTPGRMMVGGALLTASPMLSPTATALNIAAMLGSTPQAQKAIVGLLTSRPELMQKFGSLLGDYSSGIGAGAGAAGGR